MSSSLPISSPTSPTTRRQKNQQTFASLPNMVLEMEQEHEEEGTVATAPPRYKGLKKRKEILVPPSSTPRFSWGSKKRGSSSIARSSILAWTAVALFAVSTVMLAMAPQEELEKTLDTKGTSSSSFSKKVTKSVVKHKKTVRAKKRFLASNSFLTKKDKDTCRAKVFDGDKKRTWEQFGEDMENNVEWCREPAVDKIMVESVNCTCLNEVIPGKPVNLAELASWQQTFDMNRNNLKRFSHMNVDLVLWGDDLVERWYGMSYMGAPFLKEGKPALVDKMSKADQSLLDENRKAFDLHFQNLLLQSPDRRDSKNTRRLETAPKIVALGQQDDAKLSKPALGAIPLGAASEECPSMLYQLENGYLDSKIDPHIWWLVVGHNDVMAQCSYQGILAGILKIVDTILSSRPHATIVLNSILPNAHDPTVEWTEIIVPLNHALQCYAVGQDRVRFFDASSVFMQPTCSVKGGVDANYCRNESLFVSPDHIYPNPLGYTVWGKAIAAKVKFLMGPQTTKRAEPIGSPCTDSSDCEHDCTNSVCTHPGGLLPVDARCKKSPDCFTGRCDKQRGNKVCLEQVAVGRWCNEDSDCRSNKCKKRRCVPNAS